MRNVSSIAFGRNKAYAIKQTYWKETKIVAKLNLKQLIWKLIVRLK